MFSTQALRNFRIIGIFLIVLATYKIQRTQSYVDNAHRASAVLIENIYQSTERGSPSKDEISVDNPDISKLFPTDS